MTSTPSPASQLDLVVVVDVVRDQRVSQQRFGRGGDGLKGQRSGRWRAAVAVTRGGQDGLGPVVTHPADVPGATRGGLELGEAPSATPGFAALPSRRHGPAGLGEGFSLGEGVGWWHEVAAGRWW